MIYIKEDEVFCKYYVRDDSRLICEEKDGSENVILSDISDEFDAVADRSGIHFVLQGLSGELIYLKKENSVWKKYNVLKSRRGIKKIHGLRLEKSGDTLCAFYIMEHGGKNLFVKHRFCTENLYEEPEVLGTAKERSCFCFCKTDTGIVLHFKDTEGIFKRAEMDKSFNVRNIINCNFENEIISINTIFTHNKLYALCTVPKKNSTVLIFFDTQNEAAAKIISFGMAKSCRAEIIEENNRFFIQWEENGGIMQSQLMANEKSFSKPKPVNAACTMAAIRQSSQGNCVFSGKCAMYNFLPYIPGISAPKTNTEPKGRPEMKSQNTQKEFVKPKDVDFVLQRLKSIEMDIEQMGKSLDEMCSFLDRLTRFKKDINEEKFDFPKKNTEAELSGEKNLGEINSENMKLFESTDIDEVLPAGEQAK